MTKTKKCFQCNKRKSTKQFYAHPQTADGLLGKCKDCCKTSTKTNYINNQAHYQEYDRQRDQLPHRIQMRAEYAATDRGRKRGAAAKQAWAERNPEKLKAQWAAQNAVRDGRLKRKTECEVCGSEKNIEKHHDDYSKPLEVRWLCKKHHWEADRKRSSLDKN
jgi:hypothetical protein